MVGIEGGLIMVLRLSGMYRGMVVASAECRAGVADHRRRGHDRGAMSRVGVSVKTTERIRQAPGGKLEHEHDEALCGEGHADLAQREPSIQQQQDQDRE